MDMQAFVNEFMNSPHGQEAMNALGAQGISPDSAQQMLSVGAEAAHSHVATQDTGLLGEHAGKSFFAAFAAGILKGDGFMGALGDGLEGIVGAKVTESLAARLGVDPGMASTVAAAATPYLVSFIRSKFG